LDIDQDWFVNDDIIRNPEVDDSQKSKGNPDDDIIGNPNV
jgi:hypothetical protein